MVSDGFVASEIPRKDYRWYWFNVIFLLVFRTLDYMLRNFFACCFDRKHRISVTGEWNYSLIRFVICLVNTPINMLVWMFSKQNSALSAAKFIYLNIQVFYWNFGFSEGWQINKGRFCYNSEIDTLISKRLSLENKAKLS